MQTKNIIEDPTTKDGFEGMILGTQKMEEEFVPKPFDLHAAARYVREHDLPGIDDEIIHMFAY